MRNSAGMIDSLQANEVLAAEYPNSQYTADALINIGNKYYNAGSESELEQAERIRLYQMAIENYQKADQYARYRWGVKIDCPRLSQRHCERACFLRV